MDKRGWRPFWAAFFASLLVLVPLAGGTVLLTRHTARLRLEAAESQSGVAVAVPKADDRLTVLLCAAGERPGFVLAYLNAAQNCIHLLAIPAQTAVEFGGQEVTLADCYSAAGPARCREALAPLLGLPDETHYLALSAAVREGIASRFGALRVGFSGALTPDELALSGRDAAVQGISAREASDFLNGLDTSGLVPAGHRAAARAAVWDAFFRQNLELLPTTLPDALRAYSSSLLTDLTAQDYLRLETTLEFLANSSAGVTSSALPGDWDAAADRYTLTDASRAAVQTFFNIGPTAGQEASSSAP